MGSVVSALTGSGSKKAASAQVAASQAAIATQKQSLKEQLELGRESLALQEKMFDEALALGDPYRATGANALSMYESMLYGVPVEQTASYQSLQAQKSQPQNIKTRDEFRDQFLNQFKKTRNIPQGGNFSGIDSLTAQGYDAKAQQLMARELAKMGNTQSEEYIDEVGLEQAIDEAYNAQFPEATTTTEPEGQAPTLDRMGELIKTPGYQFRMDEGQKALERSAAARSGVLSGAQLKAQERFSQDYATNEFQNYMNRIGGLVNTGASMAGGGANLTMNAAGQQSGILSQMANQQGQYGANVAGLQQQIGSARASGYLGEQAAGTNLLNTGAELAGTAIMFSDPRLKQNIKHIGKEKGHNIYEFNYRGEDEKYIGVMADEVIEKKPDAVSEIQGYLAVDYSKIGVEFRRA